MQARIKILYVFDHFHFAAGGTEGQFYHLIRQLNRDLFDPHACVFRHETDFLRQHDFPCPVFCPDIGSFFALETYHRFHAIRRYIREKGIDIVQTVFNDSALSHPFFTLGTGVKVVSSRRDMGFWYTPAKLLILRLNTLFTHRYLVNSHAVEENISRAEWVPARKIVVIPNGHDLSRFDGLPREGFHSRYGIPEGAPIIGIVANLRPVKRVHDLMAAFALVLKERSDAFLVIVGHTGEMFGEYKTLAANLGIEHNVRFLGLLDDPLPIMKHFSVGVNCSESEGLSNTIIEYMGCGVPVVATDTEGNRELIVHEQTGLISPVGDAQDLAAAILRLHRDPDLRGRLVSTARASVTKRFDEKMVVRQHERFYSDLVGTARRFQHH
jgi:glycosyltransferase involved in cell wall biosynthesis